MPQSQDTEMKDCQVKTLDDTKESKYLSINSQTEIQSSGSVTGASYGRYSSLTTTTSESNLQQHERHSSHGICSTMSSNQSASKGSYSRVMTVSEAAFFNSKILPDGVKLMAVESSPASESDLCNETSGTDANHHLNTPATELSVSRVDEIDEITKIKEKKLNKRKSSQKVSKFSGNHHLPTSRQLSIAENKKDVEKRGIQELYKFGAATKNGFTGDKAQLEKCQENLA